ncbi:MAG: TlpA disulfide reductase family protein [Gammaproteobacteria bacterium]
MRRSHYASKMICIGLMLQGLTGCTDNSSKFPVSGQSFPLSALKQLKNVRGDEVDLSNKILLINFWATWCAPCRSEMPDLQLLSDRLDQNRYAVIGVSVDDDINLVREFLLQHQIRFPIFQDDNFRLASELLGIETYPDTFIVSPQGTITKRINGIIRWDQHDIENAFESSGNLNDAVTPNYPLNG